MSLRSKLILGLFLVAVACAAGAGYNYGYAVGYKQAIVDEKNAVLKGVQDLYKKLK